VFLSLAGFSLFVKERARRRALGRASPGPLRDYLAAPFADPATPCSLAEIIALDLETGGLDPRRYSILSAGLVPIRDLALRLDESWHQYARSPRDIADEAVAVHRITADRLREHGRPLAELLPRLLERLAGRVLLAHNAALETKFLDRACRELYGGPFLIPVIDTQVLARRLQERRDRPFRSGDLRLFRLRERYGLPRYKAHNALSDALAVGELFLAMAARRGGRRESRLKDFLTA